MPITKVVRDKDGQIINIGPWDYMPAEEPTKKTIKVPIKVPIKLPNGEFMVNGKGERMHRETTDERIEEGIEVVNQNPLPDGAYECEADIVEGLHGGLYEASDPRRLTG